MTAPPAGYIPAVGETDLNKVIRSVRNLYENLTTSGNVFPNGIKVTGALASGSLVDTNAVAVSTTNGIDLSACTFSGDSLKMPFFNLYGNGDADIGLNNLPLLSADTGRVATFVVKRNIAATFPALAAGNVRSAIRAVTNLANGSGDVEWTILGICNDDGNTAAGSVAVYGQCNKTRDNASMSDWGGVFEMHSNTGAANPSGSEFGIELSMAGAGNDGAGTRYGCLVSCFTSTGGARTCTISIASPAVVSLTSHGFSAGNIVVFSTTGALPTGLTAGTGYYVLAAGLTANSFEVSATSGGSAINTSGSQSGTQSVNPQYNIGTGIFFQGATSHGASMQYGIRFSATFSSILTCIDTASATVTNFVLNMAQGQKISFGNGDKNLYYNAAISSLEYQTSGGNITIGDGGKITCDSLVLTVTTVASLPAAASNLARKYFVSDATTTTFGTPVAGGSTHTVPVYSDGVNWIIG